MMITCVLDGCMASGTLNVYLSISCQIALILIRFGFANRLCFQFHGEIKGNGFGDQPVCATVSFENKTT